MPTIVTTRPYRAVDAAPRRKQWTRVECDTLEKLAGWDQQHLELIEGELINKVPKNRSHTFALSVLLAWTFKVFGDQFVNPEAPIDVAPQDNPTSQPEPDIIVLVRPQGEIRDRNPRPDELRLVVEVSDSSIGFDLTTKTDLYARAQIVEYWVVDIQARRLVVHRKPQDGLYQAVTVYTDQEAVAPLASPESEFRIADLFAA